MKKIIIFGLLNLLVITNTYTQELFVKYNSEQHTLTLKAKNSNINEIVKKLALQNVQLYLLEDNNSSFKVTRNFTNKPLDEALATIIPSSKKYFYKLDSDKEVALISKKFTKPKLINANSILLTSKQIGDKIGSSDKMKPKLKSIKALKSLKQPIILNPGNLKDKFKPKNVIFKEQNSMKTVKNIKPVATNKIKTNLILSPNLVIKKPSKKVKKHLIVTYKVTKNGMTAVSTSEEEGEYISSTEINGNQVIIGLENNKIVLANTLEDPLTYRSIYQPGISDHKTFTTKEAYITVQMPIKYKSSITSKSLDLKLVKFKNLDNAKNILQKIKTKQLFKKDVNTLFRILKSAPKHDFSKLKKFNQN